MNSLKTSKSANRSSAKNFKKSNCPIGPQMKHKLENLNSSSSLHWTLNKEQLDYIRTFYKYTIIPELYKVQTKSFKFFDSTPSIIKFISKAKKLEQKTEVICKLSKQDIEYLNEYDILYSPYKYRITRTPPKTNEY